MSRYIVLPLMIVALVADARPAHAQTAGADGTCPAHDGTVGTPIEIVRYLADDALEGRFSGSPGEACAAEYIARSFAALGLEPAGSDGFFQELELATIAAPHAPAGRGRNVLGLLRGDGGAADEVVIIGAHYDHLGRGEFGSTGEMGEIHNGADDNASGVAAMIDAARRLSEGARPSRSVLFIAFTGEELGLIGSGYYAKNPVIPLERTAAMINLDMVGRLEGGDLIVYGVGTASEWEAILPAANVEPAISMAFEPSGFGPSDHTSFYASDIPVLHLFSNVHGDYHRETDDWEKIDVPGLERVAHLTANIAREVANRPGRLAVISGVGERAQRSGGYGAWLGTVPDFTPVDHGVLLAGVTEGSPASEAGLRKGDILVGIGDADVGTLQAFTDVLRAHRPGDEVLLRFIRDGRALEAPVVLGDRANRPR
ncbi:MAG: M20/M25/M40 family metallo-hydrolase [Gemmatimonadetes bacterium]|nr:M20/M25/M40 family metallo-hydrolase [Gemmatimonadota bacterium]